MNWTTAFYTTICNSSSETAAALEGQEGWTVTRLVIIADCAKPSVATVYNHGSKTEAGEETVTEILTTRRVILAGPLALALFAGLSEQTVQAAGVDPGMTMITPPDQIPWVSVSTFAPGAAETVPLFGRTSEQGQ